MEESMSITGRPRKTGGTLFHRKNSVFWWIRYRNRDGQILKESTGAEDPQEAERFLRQRLDARDDGHLPTVLSSKNLTFNEWADWFLENRSKPPFRAEKTHLQNLRIVELLRTTLGSQRLSDVSSEAIEQYLRRRLSSGRRVPTKLGVQYRGTIKPMTVHQEFRVLRRILNVAVKQKRLTSNPCGAVEFPVTVSKTTQKPHYTTLTEQKQIEFFASKHLKHAIVIISEMGLRPYKELMPMQKSQVDLENSLVHVPDSKTTSGIGDMPMTRIARQAFKARMDETPGSDYLFPSPKKDAKKPYITTLKKTWTATLRRAGVAYFPLYHLRHTFASRLSAGGVSDHFVTLMLRQGDADVFKRYSQAKFNMMREALGKLDRHANEHRKTFGTPRPN
jgi:integrase